MLFFLRKNLDCSALGSGLPPVLVAQAAVAWTAELLWKVVHFVRKLARCGRADQSLDHHRQFLACLLLELAACALADARLGALKAVLHRRMDASLRELPRGLGKRTTSDPW